VTATERSAWTGSSAGPNCAVRTDRDEGLFAGSASVTFEAPVRAGDVLEATAGRGTVVVP